MTRVFLTGHTGFKGSWLAAWLGRHGAVVRGYALEPEARPNLFETLKLSRRMEHVAGDIRDASRLRRELRAFRPEIVFHLAAQPLVRRSYREPALTFETNALGTVNLLEACRDLDGLRAVVCVTTDKCYENQGRRSLRESDPLGGSDPYAASKACAELAAASYRRSFGLRAATARAGNVIGGGDWNEDRLLPDAVRAFSKGRAVAIRSPQAVRPWQHVLEPLGGYLVLAQALASGAPRFARAYNFGPSQRLTVRRVIEEFGRRWPGAKWKRGPGGPAEAAYLALDSGLAARQLGWRTRLTFQEMIRWTADWYRSYYAGEDMWDLTQAQIGAYEAKTAFRPGAAAGPRGGCIWGAA